MAAEDFNGGDGWISDESSFYGDDDVKDMLEHKAHRSLKRPFDSLVPTCSPKKVKLSPAVDKATAIANGEEGVLKILKSRPQLSHLAADHRSDIEPPERRLPRPAGGEVADDLVEVNQFKKHPTGWQQDEETIGEFLCRLPVLDPVTAENGDWLWVGSPQLPWSHLKRRKSEDLGTFETEAAKIIGDFTAQREKFEMANPEKEPSSITRKMAPYRDQLESDLLALAVRTGATSGKWMLFPNHEELPDTWRVVATATSECQLGHTCKVATYDSIRPTTLICVYTYDFSDTADVVKVLRELVELGLCSSTSRPIYYKCDAYTYLGITSDNPYRLKASLFSSKELLQNEIKALKDGPVARLAKRNKKMDEFHALFDGGDIS